MKNILKDLVMLNGIPGNERQVREYMTKEMNGLSELTYDNLGSVIGKKVGNPDGPRIMVAGHMDEVGFMVTTITDEGYVKFTPAGGWWSQVMLAQQMVITTGKGEEIRAVIGAKAPHILTVEERAKPVDMKKMYLDLGVDTKEEAVALGIDDYDEVLGEIYEKYKKGVEKEDMMNNYDLIQRYLCASFLGDDFIISSYEDKKK